MVVLENTNHLQDIHHPYIGRDLPWLLEQRAHNRSDHPFLIWEPFEGEAKSWTYLEFYQDALKVAAGLWAHGIRQGDYVLIHMDNCPEFMLTWHALQRIGAVAVTTNTRAALDEIAYFAQHCNAKAAITEDQYLDLVLTAAPQLSYVFNHNSKAPEDAENNAVVKAFAELYQYGDEVPTRDRDCNIYCSIQYTSGTTSRPKGVAWTHALALWAGDVNASQWGLKNDDVTLVYLPLFHTNAIAYSMLAVIWSGSTMVLQPKFSGSRFWDLSVKHKITWASMVPFVLKVALKGAIPEQHSYRFWATGFSCHPEVTEKIGIPSLGLWGMTEVPVAGTISDTRWEEPAMTIGRPSMYYQFKVVDENNNQVKAGETGLLKVKGVRGLSIFAEYLNNPEATAAAFDEDGWFDTGDLVTPLAEGSIAFADRAKDMLKVGGENVAAMEVERAVYSVPGVTEAAVIGIPHEMLDEVPVVYVVSDLANKDELREQILHKCRELLADFKVPREVIFMDSLPKAAIGKIAKHKLRKLWK